jgi:hypothetical protein
VVFLLLAQVDVGMPKEAASDSRLGQDGLFRLIPVLEGIDFRVHSLAYDYRCWRTGGICILLRRGHLCVVLCRWVRLLGLRLDGCCTRGLDIVCSLRLVVN